MGRSAAEVGTSPAYRRGSTIPEARKGAIDRVEGYAGLAFRFEEEPVIALTDTAAVKVQELITAEGDTALALRVAVRPGGCSGFSYEMFFDTDFAEDDLDERFGDVRVVVDAASAQLLTGATLDYRDGLNQAGFSINNPNATRTCGCGSSFS